MIEKIKKMWPDWDVADNLGGGSFGQVYEIHRDVFGQIDKAALKVLSIPKNKGEIKELEYNGYDKNSITEHYKNHLADIVKEYNLMAKLKGCANVVYCEDVRYIQQEDGISWDVYIKMELLKPLAANLAMPCDEQQVIKIGIDICNALILCKEKGIIHRDIKPQNLFVSDDGTYKLGDFGIAKTIERTMGGTRTGTYNYMAPEVYNNQPQGTALDQYSLGMVLYWILNNRRVPFMPAPPAIPTASQEEDARAKRMSGSEPIPAPANGSDGLKAIVLKAIAHNPKDRFESPEAMRDALYALMQFGSKADEAKIAMGEDVADEICFEETDGDIKVIEGTVGNSWSFDEKSVGPEFSKLFNDFEAEGTVGVDNAPKATSKVEDIHAAPKVEPTPATPVTPIDPVTKINPTTSVKPVEYLYEGWAKKPLNAFGLEGYFIDHTNVDDVLKLANSRSHEKGYIEIISVCHAIKKGMIEKYCYNAVAPLKEAKDLFNKYKAPGNQTNYRWHIWNKLAEVLYYDPFNEEAIRILKELHEEAPITFMNTSCDQQSEYNMRIHLMLSPNNYIGYQEACVFYKNHPKNTKHPHDSYNRAMWYFEKGKLLDKMEELKNDASYKEVVTAYLECAMFIGNSSGDKSFYEKVDKVLNAAETAGFDASITGKYRTLLSKKVTPKKGLFGGLFK